MQILQSDFKWRVPVIYPCRSVPAGVQEQLMLEHPPDMRPRFCDVALAVPLDIVFTYAVPPGMEPVVGGRVLVPFRQQRLSGIVVELHDRAPPVLTSPAPNEDQESSGSAGPLAGSR